MVTILVFLSAHPFPLLGLYTLVSVVLITLELGSPALYSPSHKKQHNIFSPLHKHIRLAWGYCSLVAYTEIKVGLSPNKFMKHTLLWRWGGSQTFFYHGTFQKLRSRKNSNTIHHQDLATVTMLPYFLLLCIFVLGHFKVNRHHDALFKNILAYYKEQTLSNINIISSYLTKFKGVLWSHLTSSLWAHVFNLSL